VALKTGPLRRVVGTAGLVALAPTAYLLANGSITPGDAAVRAGATLAAVVIVGRVARWWLAATASAFERAGSDDAASTPAAGPPAGAERRR
jgi:hypothetical protein